MNIWRLIAHHEEGENAIELMKEKSRIAIGWSKIGDLILIGPKNASDITSSISLSYKSRNNSHLGGPSLWNLYSEMEEGDLVIINTGGRRRCVFEVGGPYFFNSTDSILEYYHQRFASLTDIDPERLWNDCGSKVLEGQNSRWTLAACGKNQKTKDRVLQEGKKYSVLSTAVERNPLARLKCVEYYGCSCAVCQFHFVSTYGEIGEDYIHVHHRVDFASRNGVHSVDPTTDLIPLCPNCHAMVHTTSPAMNIDRLIEIMDAQRNA